MDGLIEKLLHIEKVVDELRESANTAHMEALRIANSLNLLKRYMREVLRNAVEAQKEVPKTLCNGEMSVSEVLCNILEEMKTILLKRVVWWDDHDLLVSKVQQCLDIVRKPKEK